MIMMHLGYLQENVKCGSNTCDKNEVCDTETKTCRVKECTPPKESDSVDILGNMASIGSKKHVSCKEGFIPTAGSKFATVAECHTDGWENDLECVPLTCKGLADMGENTSGMYKSYDESSQIVIDIFCEFNDGIKIGYSYLAPGTLSSSVNISKHYTRKDHVMLRHVRNDNVQYESKMKIIFMRRIFPV
ncbi:uncharacterized protein LOC123561186 [Mercenaria mercenaria]|uniref:uncharacterized protein LOC123561186 n=1 Tax=Mercenaria mercenaria TaxID=6596 RepID=UPI00234F8126|nr:uncharacterized protein LOC123561186 [Mercenaria mercenaria]